MIIGEPTITDADKEVCVSADVRFETPGLDVPDTVWFRFPSEYRPYLIDRSDAFVAGLLLAAMYLGEDIEVEGRVSPRLAHGVRQYQLMNCQWWPQRFSRVDVRYADVTRGTADRAGHVTGGAFSGGVDSFYSVWQHMPEHETVPALRLTHCLMVNGFNFDMHLEDTHDFQRLVETYEPMLRGLGIELLVARNNTQLFLEAASEKAAAHLETRETVVIASVLMLGKLLSRFYIPGGGAYRLAGPHGWHPVGLPMLSSDDTEILFDGGEATRVEKTLVLAGWEETYSRLRVCWRPTVFNEETGLIENCCRCPKCIRTIATLDLAGALSKYKTFPLPLERRHIRATSQVSPGEKYFYFDLLELAQKAGRSDMIYDLRYARFASRLRAFGRDRLLRRLLGRGR
jgi:hypothetical protein